MTGSDSVENTREIWGFYISKSVSRTLSPAGSPQVLSKSLFYECLPVSEKGLARPRI